MFGVGLNYYAQTRDPCHNISRNIQGKYSYPKPKLCVGLYTVRVAQGLRWLGFRMSPLDGKPVNGCLNLQPRGSKYPVFEVSGPKYH